MCTLLYIAQHMHELHECMGSKLRVQQECT